MQKKQLQQVLSNWQKAFLQLAGKKVSGSYTLMTMRTKHEIWKVTRKVLRQHELRTSKWSWCMRVPYDVVVVVASSHLISASTSSRFFRLSFFPVCCLVAPSSLAAARFFFLAIYITKMLYHKIKSSKIMFLKDFQQPQFDHN